MTTSCWLLLCPRNFAEFKWAPLTHLILTFILEGCYCSSPILQMSKQRPILGTKPRIVHKKMHQDRSYPNTDEWMKWPAQIHLPLSVLFSAAWMLFWDRISPVIWVCSWGPWFALPESYQAVITVGSGERIFKCCHSQAVGLHKLALSLLPLSDLVS